MKLTKIIGAILSICCILTGCNNGEPTTVYIDPPDLPDYSEYVTLGSYKNLSYELTTDYAVNDDDVQQALENSLSSAMTFEEVTDRAAELGDTVQIMYTGTVDGNTFDGGSTGSSGATITLGQAGYVDGFENQIVGMSVNDTKLIKVTFPENYGNKELNGKEAEFSVKMLAIVHGTLPEITDELIQKHTDYDSISDAKTKLRKHLEESAEQSRNNEIYINVLNQIITTSDCKSYPDDIIDNLVQTAISSAEQNAALYSMDIDEYIAANHEANSLEEFKTAMETQAKEYMKTRMIICEIARRENLNPTPEEFTEYKTQFAQNNGFSSIQNVNLYYKDEDLAVDCIYDKVQSWLIVNAQAKG